MSRFYGSLCKYIITYCVQSQPDHDRYLKSSEYLADILSDWHE